MTLNFCYFPAILICVSIKVNHVIPGSTFQNIYFTDTSGADIADYIASKGYIPNEKELPQVTLNKNKVYYANYILSKLSDEELLKLLNEPTHKNEYDLQDIVKLAFNLKEALDQSGNRSPLHGDLSQENRIKQNNKENQALQELNRFRTNSETAQSSYFKLNHKAVDPNSGKNDANYRALQKLKHLMDVYPRPKAEENYDVDDDKKELIFDILVSQIKSLCCKKSKKSESKKGQYKTLINEILPLLSKHNMNTNPVDMNDSEKNEFMFLIMNDEIKSNSSEELISVDPNSLDGNSSVLLLGPVTTPLSDDKLKLIMNRISMELIKPEYISLLQQLSDGVFIDGNKNVKTIVFGPETRRYIKPHRCNHQSKLTKIYGGPKWLICTGYLNLNKPSLYD